MPCGESLRNQVVNLQEAHEAMKRAAIPEEISVAAAELEAARVACGLITSDPDVCRT